LDCTFDDILHDLSNVKLYDKKMIQMKVNYHASI